MRWIQNAIGMGRGLLIRKKPMILHGTAAPDFTLPDLDGHAVRLADLRRDRPALLAFFKVSCPVCQLTLPFLNRLLPSTKMRVVTISQDDATVTQRFRARFGVTAPTLLDDEERGYPVSNAYKLTNVPSLFLVEPDGAISLASNGFAKADLEAIAARAGVEIFGANEQVPVWRPG